MSRRSKLTPLTAIAGGYHELISTLDGFSNDKVRFSTDKLKVVLITERSLYRNIRSTDFHDLVDKDTVYGFSGFMLYLSFKAHKRRVIKLSRRIRGSLKKAISCLIRNKLKKAYRYLDRAVSYCEDILRALIRLDEEINTETGTAKTVQIQIQKKERKM